MNNIQIATYTSIAAIAISLFFIGTELTGYATGNDTAIVNITIDKSAEIDFTNDTLDFGSGAVTLGQTAIVDSEGTNISWSGNKTWGELVLENIGITNLTLQLKSDLSPGEFIGGAAPAFQAKVTNSTGENGSCIGFNAFANYSDINTTLQTACGIMFVVEDTNDEIIIDFRLNISDDALGEKEVKITAVGTS